MTATELSADDILELKTSERLKFERASIRANLIEPKYIQAFITNIVAPKTLDDLYNLTIKAPRNWLTMDDILYACRNEPTEWTTPRWAKKGDIVFFMHSKTSNSNLTAIRTALERNKRRYNERDWQWLKFWVNHELDVYKMYGGKIFAIGRVTGNPFSDEESSQRNPWKSTIYAAIDDIQYLKEPIDISEFNEFITVNRQGAITAVLDEDYYKLMDLIASKNKIPKRFMGLQCGPVPLSRINDDNWFEIMQVYRRAFFLEAQFRSYSVDYLLRAFGDRRTFYEESRCQKRGHPDTYVDNMVLYRDRWLPVEVKLNIDLEKDLPGQLRQYMDVGRVAVTKEKTLKRSELWLDRVLVVDTEGVYLYFRDELHYLLLWEKIGSAKEALAMLNTRLEEECEW